MRQDKGLEFRPEFRPRGSGGIGGSGFSEGASLSGHERNHLFVNDGRGNLVDASGVSGLDAPADGRALAWTDLDRDGWLDFVVVNANAPTLQLFRNQMGDSRPENGVVAIRLVGGNTSAKPSEKWSNRDGIGASLELHVGDRRLVREQRAGEGFAAQNGSTIVVGIGAAEKADGIFVRWPSGQTQATEAVPRGSLVTFYENPTRAGSDSPAKIEPYAVPSDREGTLRTAYQPSRTPIGIAGTADRSGRIRIYTTTATWCEVCRSELADIALLRSTFPPEELGLYAVPVDENDTREKLEAYLEANAPAYEMLLEVTPPEVADVKTRIIAALRQDALPASIVTNERDEVIDVSWGVPTVSDVRSWLRNAR
ncbi:MAG: ASPIC/UnbV domain-containing protein [Candidatus Binatia bacterium]|nr:ASPIC/UnbV domain-containing protein [Candidatus Binatia bacterium]